MQLQARPEMHVLMLRQLLINAFMQKRLILCRHHNHHRNFRIRLIKFFQMDYCHRLLLSISGKSCFFLQNSLKHNSPDIKIIVFIALSTQKKQLFFLPSIYIPNVMHIKQQNLIFSRLLFMILVVGVDAPCIIRRFTGEDVLRRQKARHD